MATLSTAAFAEAHQFTKGQAISFEIINLTANGMNVREAMEQVCGVAASELPADSTDSEILQAVQDTFFESVTPEQMTLLLS